MSKRQTNNSGAQAMLGLFREEALKLVKSVKNDIANLHQLKKQAPRLKKINNNVRALKTGAAITGIGWIIEQMQLVDDLLVEHLQNQQHFSKSLSSLVSRCIDQIDAFCDIDNKQTKYCREAIKNTGLELAKTLNDIKQHSCPDNEIVAQEKHQERHFADDPDMLLLFRQEVDTNVIYVNEQIIALEENPDDVSNIEAMMRSAHSIKGAARMVKHHSAVKLANLLESTFEMIRKNRIDTHSEALIDLLLNGVDCLRIIAYNPNEAENKVYCELVDTFEAILNNPDKQSEILSDSISHIQTHITQTENMPVQTDTHGFNDLLALSSDMLVASRWIPQHTQSMVALKQKNARLALEIDNLLGLIYGGKPRNRLLAKLTTIKEYSLACQQDISKQLAEIDDHERRTTPIISRINQEVLNSRFRPFASVVTGFRRMTRDLARSLGKKVNIDINGLDTLIDQDFADKLGAPLTQLIKNAIDHGIESPRIRQQIGKPEVGHIELSAYHHAGMLSIVISDDGQGIDFDLLKSRIIDKGFAKQDIVDKLSAQELLSFLFLPGFTSRSEVTDISGRGVGLDIVQHVVQELQSTLLPDITHSKHFKIEIRLPLTLSIMRCIVVRILGEAYAFPLAKIETTVRVHFDKIKTINDWQYIDYNNQLVRLIDGSHVLYDTNTIIDSDELLLIILKDADNFLYGIIVDQFIGEHELSIKPLDNILGKIRDINSAAILEDGSPALVIDTDDFIQSVQRLVDRQHWQPLQQTEKTDKSRARILVVEDSLTVRELQRKILVNNGFITDVAIDGVDGWNHLQLNKYDLVITDVDMPRMNGLQLVEKIRSDNALANLPVVIMSYKDQEANRQADVAGGADYYLSKSNFSETVLLDVVAGLI